MDTVAAVLNIPQRLHQLDEFMHWVAPSEKDTNNAVLEKRLWEAADQFRANSGLKSHESEETGRRRLLNLL